MPNYQNGKIYAIRSHETDEIYIGSTTETLAQRLAKHRGSLKHWKEGKGAYTSSFEILKYPTCYIELVEEHPCNSKMELEKKEGEYIRKMNCVNKIIVGRTQKEYDKQYYLDNAEKLKDKTKQYYLDNTEKIKEHANQKNTCECGGKYTTQNKSQHLKSKKHQAFISSSSASSSS